MPHVNHGTVCDGQDVGQPTCPLTDEQVKSGIYTVDKGILFNQERNTSCHLQQNGWGYYLLLSRAMQRQQGRGSMSFLVCETAMDGVVVTTGWESYGREGRGGWVTGIQACQMEV